MPPHPPMWGCGVRVHSALLDDRDLAAFCTGLDGDLESPDGLLSLAWADRRIPVGRIQRAEVATRFAFISEPA